MVVQHILARYRAKQNSSSHTHGMFEQYRKESVKTNLPDQVSDENRTRNCAGKMWEGNLAMATS